MSKWVDAYESEKAFQKSLDGWAKFDKVINKVFAFLIIVASTMVIFIVAQMIINTINNK